MEPKDKLIVALDVDTRDEALKLVAALKESVGLFKIGLELFTLYGPDIVDDIKKAGGNVFLDLKFHDIPNTVARSASAAVKLGVSMFSVHALGGYDMMKKAGEAAKSTADEMKTARPKVLAVTILTSMDAGSIKKVGIEESLESEVLSLAKSAKEAWLDGVVASPAEVKALRKAMGNNFLIVTPGVRPLWASHDDQRRVATPLEAFSNGADYIVVGRPITGAPKPKEAVKKLLKEIAI